MKQVEAILAGEIGDDKPILRANPRVPGSFGASEEMHTGRAMIFLQPWDKREKSTAEVAGELEKKFAGMTGVRVRTQVGGGLVRTRGQPFQMVLGGPDYAELARWRDIMLAKMAENPGFIGPDSDYKETRPQMRVIDRQDPRRRPRRVGAGDRHCAGNHDGRRRSPPSSTTARNTT
jgi:multidrug efflux pump